MQDEVRQVVRIEATIATVAVMTSADHAKVALPENPGGALVGDMGGHPASARR